MSNQDIADFQGAEINFAEQYHSIRKMMGTVGTDLEFLRYNTTLMYVSAPDKWLKPYFNLVQEIEQRATILQSKKNA